MNRTLIFPDLAVFPETLHSLLKQCITGPYHQGTGR